MTADKQEATDLDPEAALNVALSLVVLPEDTELDDALRDLDNLEGLLVLGVLLKELLSDGGSEKDRPGERDCGQRRNGDDLEQAGGVTHGSERRGELVEGLARQRQRRVNARAFREAVPKAGRWATEEGETLTRPLLKLGDRNGNVD